MFFADPCFLRAGTLTDSSLYYRKLAELKRGTFASPEYLVRFGTPRTLDDLASGHRMMGLLAPDSPSIRPLAFIVAGKVQELMLPAVVTVTGPDMNLASACAGLGIARCRATAWFPSLPRVRLSNCWRTTRRRSCRCMPSIPIHVSFRHACASDNKRHPYYELVKQAA